MVAAIDRLALAHPEARKFVVKLNEGFSGEGNAIFTVPWHLANNTGAATRRERILGALRRMRFQATRETWESFKDQITKLGAIVELFVPGDNKRSPSCQGYISPQGEVEVLSTHEQVLGGPDGQVFLGCAFPADPAYGVALIEATRKVGEALARRGAIGRFAVDYLAVMQQGGQWAISAIEINLRPGGTTHPMNTLKRLTGGVFDEKTGELRSARTGVAKAYVASDNFVDEGLAHKKPDDVITALRTAGLEFDRATEKGVVLHMMGALPKVGYTAIADSPSEAKELSLQVEAALRQLAQAGAP
jgi:hypothetical protein